MMSVYHQSNCKRPPNVPGKVVGEADDLHLSGATRALQRVDFIETVDKHCPRGKRAARRRLLGVARRTIDGGLERFGLDRLFAFLAYAALPMRVPTVIANQVLALVWNVLRDFGQEVQRAEDLKVTLRAAAQIGAGRTGKAATVVLFGTVGQIKVSGTFISFFRSPSGP